MYEKERALSKRQIKAVAVEAKKRKIERIYAVSCGGSLATLYPLYYILKRETDAIATEYFNAAEFAADPPKKIDKKTLVVLNSQSGTTAETIAAAKTAKKRGALTAAFTVAPKSEIEKATDFAIYYYDNPDDPYPLILTIYPEVFELTAELLDALTASHMLKEMRPAMEGLEAVCERTKKDFAREAHAFAADYADAPLLYTISAGMDKCAAYILTNCSFMESVWKHSSPLNAGELFHGACEAIDKDTPVVAFLGTGAWRKVEERAVKFLQRITDRLTVLDASAYDLDAFAPSVRPYVATLVLHSMASEYCLKISQRMGHPMDSRRYMGVLKY